MLAMAMQSTAINSLLAPSTIGRTSSLANPTTKLVCSSKRKRPCSRNALKFRALAAAEALAADTAPPAKKSWEFYDELNEVEVEPIEKPRLVLKFIWMEKNIGLALDQLIPEYGAVPLSPYFFWPRKDAWEELKTTLESKPWISQKKMIILLNQATDIINLWQQSGGNLTSSL